tara:strand:- start:2256 stop:3908 length:1653 start_codon:yes stop_codon:yes gene_type:complete
MAGTPVNALDIANDGTLYSNSGQVTSISTGASGTVYTSTGINSAPSWVAPTAGGITTLGSDSGTATGTTVNVLAGFSSQNCGSSVLFTGATDTIQLDVTDALTNTIVGKLAGNATLTGSSNTIYGSTAGSALTSGSHNCFVGVAAGGTISTQDSNIYLNTSGNPESNTLRIGSGTGTGPKELTFAFISGINGNTLGGTPKMVTIDTTTDQLGVDDIPSGGSVTIAGDTGSISGSSLTIKADVSSSPNCGGTVNFSNSGTTSILNFTDSHGNTFLGNQSGSATNTAGNNTTLGFGSMNGALATDQNNIAIGYYAMNTGTLDRQNNVSIGHSSNVGDGGNYNIVIGSSAGASLGTSPNGNILINSSGSSADTNTLRIGSSTGGSAQQLSKAFISGINGVTSSSPAIVTTNTGTDQLGTMPYVLNETFTPTLLGDTTAGVTTYVTQTGYYTRIGNMIFAQGSITISGATGTGRADIGGFPFSSNSQSNGETVGSILLSTDTSWTWAGGTSICMYLAPGHNSAWIGISGTASPGGVINMGTGQATLVFSITYTV